MRTARRCVVCLEKTCLGRDRLVIIMHRIYAQIGFSTVILRMTICRQLAVIDEAHPAAAAQLVEACVADMRDVVSLEVSR